MISSVISAEAKLGKPPSVIEIFVEMKRQHNISMVSNIYEGAAVITSLFREDMLFANDVCSHYSVTRHEGFLNYTEIFRKKIGEGYKINKDGTVAVTTAPTLNFRNLTEMLKSKDAALFEQAQWMWNGDFKFLDGEVLPSKIAFNTFPRSGNSFLRRLLEQVTGISTGATVQLHTSTSLQCMGLKGEQIVDDRTWIIKAHHPSLLPMATKFASDKVICCVRNPLDVILSFASLSNTMSHSANPEFDYATDYPEWWAWWVKTQAITHAKYFEILLRHCTKEGKNPIYICRYEDLVSDSKKELDGIMKFLLDVDDLSGTNCERRIDQLSKLGGEASQAYKLKPNTGKFNANRGKYSEELVEFIKETNADLLYYFGYTDHPTEQNTTAFFNFKEHKPANVEKFYGFRADNEKVVKQLAKDGGWKGPKYQVN